MRSLFVFAAALFFAGSAHAAIRIINNSAEAQTVYFTFAGHDQAKTLAVGETSYFIGSDGFLAIDVAKQTIKATDAIPGRLSSALGDLTANTRTSRIPARDGDVFMIWPDGRLMFQMRQRAAGGSSF